MIDEYLKVLDLKDLERTGWQIYNVEEPETVAEHSWSVATLTMIHLPQNLDMEKALKTALIHDIGESVVGDIPYRADSKPQTEEKENKEKEAVENISEKLDKEISTLYKDYSQRKSEEAQFVKDMDLIDMVLQALKYEKQGRYQGNPETNYESLDEFFETSRNRFNTEKGRELFKRIEDKYLQVKE